MAGRKRPIPNIKIRIGVSILVAICVFLISNSDFLGELNMQFSHNIYQTESVTSLPVTIVAIDEKTISVLGQHYTWSRQVYADLINKLNEGDVHPSVIGFDIMFTGPKDEAGDRAFAEAAEKYGNVVVGINTTLSDQGSGRERLTEENLYRYDSMTYPYEELKNVVSFGLVNCYPDRYDYITSAYMGIWYGDVWYDSLSVQILKKFKEYVDSDPVYAENHPEYENIEIPDFSKEEIYRYKFSYSEGPGGFEHVSLIDVLNGDVSAASLANNIVLVGAYAPGLQDDFKVLLENEEGQSTMYGVEIHANIMEAVSEGLLQTEADPTVMAVIYALVIGVLCFAMLSVNIIKGIIMTAVTLILYFMIAIIMYKNGIYILLLYMVSFCVLLMIGIVVFHYLSARSERMKINKAFRMYVAPEIVDDVAGSGTYQLQLGGRNKDIAVLFVDIRGFTTMSENLDPEEVVDILNEYFGVITDAIFKNKGTLDKFIGDAAMAVFNSPFDLDDYVYRAVMTACDIAKASEALGEKLMERFGKKVSYGIGVNCGEAIIGNIGSNFRMDYTAIGDTVNTAARLESNAKAGEILISEEVKKRLEGRIETEDVGEIPLKGKHNKIFVYRVKLS